MIWALRKYTAATLGIWKVDEENFEKEDKELSIKQKRQSQTDRGSFIYRFLNAAMLDSALPGHANSVLLSHDDPSAWLSTQAGSQ